MTSAPPDADIRLYYRPGSAALAPHGALLAAGVEPELVYVGRDGDAVDPPDYVRLNPMGVVPTLVRGDLVVTEAAAVVQYVADSWPAAGLLPTHGTRERVRAVELLAFLSTTPQQALLRFLYPERYTTASHAEGCARPQRPPSIASLAGSRACWPPSRRCSAETFAPSTSTCTC